MLASLHSCLESLTKERFASELPQVLGKIYFLEALSLVAACSAKPETEIGSMILLVYDF